MPTSKNKGRRSAEDAEKTRLIILKVARDLFCEMGYSRVSLRNISEKAGISHSLIRHHFGSKEQIWRSISDSIHHFMALYSRKILDEVPRELAVNTRIYQFIVRMLAFNLVYPQPTKLMADVVREEGDRFDYYVDNSGRLQQSILEMVDEYNQRTQSDLELAEIKWLLIMFSHGAASMAPFMRQTWPNHQQDNLKCLHAHWQMFNQLMIKKLNICPEDELNPTELAQLVHAVDDIFEPNEGKI